MAMINYMEEAKKVLGTAVEIRRHLHMFPEPSKQEFKTADYIAKHLQSLGLEIALDYAGELPSVVGLLRGNSDGPTVALRADIDALRFNEQNDTEYKSKVSGVMHACGHDAHTATLLCAAEILSKHKAELAGNIKFLFEPAEEDVGGLQFMIKNGVLENPHVSAAFGLHVENAYQNGHICICHGEMEAASDRLIIKIKGKSVHGASPHKGIDAIIIAAHFLLAIQTMMAREKDTFQHAVITFGQIQGGTARNIVCDEVLINGICRTLNTETREMLNRRIDEILKGITTTFGGGYEFERQRSHPALYSNPNLTDFVAGCAKEILGPAAVEEMEHAWLGCESFAYLSQAVPSSFFWLGTGNKEKDITAALHTNKFDIDESSMANGIAMHCALVCKYLQQHSSK